MFPYWIDLQMTLLPQILVALAGVVSLYMSLVTGPR
jgi:hypothetical protein